MLANPDAVKMHTESKALLEHIPDTQHNRQSLCVHLSAVPQTMSVYISGSSSQTMLFIQLETTVYKGSTPTCYLAVQLPTRLLK